MAQANRRWRYVLFILPVLLLVHATAFTSAASVADPAGDFPDADITDLSCDAGKGVLYVRIDLARDPAGSYGGAVFVDADRNPSTGYREGTGASLEKAGPGLAEEGYAETAGVPLGIPYNDAMFLAAGNQAFFRIPLTLLGSDDGRASIVLDSFPLDELSSAGELDQVPDTGAGAIDSATGRILPPLAYTGQPVLSSDRAGDSAGFGYDGDDIVSVETGYAGSILLVNVTYASLEPDDGAITTLFFDTDQAGDGLFESAFVCSLYNGKLDALLVGDTGGVFGASGVRHLVTMRGNSIHASVPLELLNDDGKLDLYVETALVPSRASIPLTELRGRVWEAEERTGRGEVHINPDKFNRTVYDRAPDTGFIPVAS